MWVGVGLGVTRCRTEQAVIIHAPRIKIKASRKVLGEVLKVNWDVLMASSPFQTIFYPLE
jgi:hypothetical protein